MYQYEMKAISMQYIHFSMLGKHIGISLIRNDNKNVIYYKEWHFIDCLNRRGGHYT